MFHTNSIVKYYRFEDSFEPGVKDHLPPPRSIEKSMDVQLVVRKEEKTIFIISLLCLTGWGKLSELTLSGSLG